MTSDTPGLAGSWHQTFTSDEPVPGTAQRLNPEQQARWAYLLHEIQTALNTHLLARAKARTEGYVLGLRDAGAVTELARCVLEQDIVAAELATLRNLSSDI
jgi:hypothetical protein